jgi:hypothetical protein
MQPCADEAVAAMLASLVAAAGRRARDGRDDFEQLFLRLAVCRAFEAAAPFAARAIRCQPGVVELFAG